MRGSDFGKKGRGKRQMKKAKNNPKKLSDGGSEKP
jgi:hypothetical protein